jgi:hypothetical protein
MEVFMLDHNKWMFINTFAPWLSALGTIAVVCVSLYLAKTKTKVTIEAAAAFAYVNNELFFLVTVVNTGPLDVEITGISISSLFKQYSKYFFSFDTRFSNSLPTRLSFAQKANYLILITNKDDFLKSRFADLIKPCPKIMVHMLRIVVDTSINKKFNCKNTFKKDILKAIGA